MGWCSISTANRHLILNIFLPWLLVVFLLLPDPMHFSLFSPHSPLGQGSANFLQDRKYLRLWQPSTCDIIIQLCHCSTKVARDIHKLMCGWITVKLYLQKQVVGQIWPAGCSLLIPDLEWIIIHRDNLNKGVWQIGRTSNCFHWSLLWPLLKSRDWPVLILGCLLI